MYAVIKTGGKQHKVAEGEILKVEKLKASEVLDFRDQELVNSYLSLPDVRKLLPRDYRYAKPRTYY